MDSQSRGQQHQADFEKSKQDWMYLILDGQLTKNPPKESKNPRLESKKYILEEGNGNLF